MEEVWDFLARDDLTFEWSETHLPLSVPFELKPEDFIAFAKEDLKENTERSMVNALSNIKRAMDCRVLSLLYFLGIYGKAKKENWNFPKSADFLLRVGVLAPNILKKNNRKRNELEHDFKKPTCEEVTDYFDVASLFLGLTNQFLNKTYGDFHLCERLSEESHNPSWLSIKLNYEKELIELMFVKKKCMKELEIPLDNEESYIRVLSQLVKHLLNR